MYPWQANSFYSPRLFGNGGQTGLLFGTMVGHPNDFPDDIDPLAPSNRGPEDALGRIPSYEALALPNPASQDNVLPVLNTPSDPGRRSECIERCWHILDRPGSRASDQNQWNFEKCLSACMQGLWPGAY
jgi:hypothetical protein